MEGLVQGAPLEPAELVNRIRLRRQPANPQCFEERLGLGRGIPGPYEPFVVESLPLRLSDMIEDEIILALPSIPRHELAQCPASEWLQEKKPSATDSGADDEQRQSPFSALADLNTQNKGK